MIAVMAVVDEESFTLDIIPASFAVAVTSSEATVCAGESVTLTAMASPTQAVGSYTYEWTTTTSAAVLSNSDSYSTTVNSTTTFICKVTDSGIAGTNGVVSNQVTVTTVPPIAIDSRSNVTVSNSYTFPAITGTNLSGGEAYYTAPNGGGTRFNAGDVVDRSDFTSFPVTLYIYDSNGNCESTETYDLIIEPIVLTVTITPSDTDICEGETINLTAVVNPNSSY